jgi:hypothetical protein
MTPVGRVISQAISRRPVTTEAWVRAQVSTRGICGEQIGTGTGFSPSCLVFPCQYNSSLAVHTHMSPGGWTTGPLVAAVQRHNLSPSTWTTWRPCELLRWIDTSDTCCNILKLYVVIDLSKVYARSVKDLTCKMLSNSNTTRRPWECVF